MGPLTVERLLNEIIGMREALVRGRLLTPSETSEFAYGRLSGEYLGFERVILHINQRLEEAEREDDEDEVSELRTDDEL